MCDFVVSYALPARYQEHDFKFQLTQEEFDKIFQPLADRVEAPIRKCLEMAGLKNSDLDSVEIVGGGTRVALFKQRIAAVLERDLSAPNFGLSSTLNQDECVARGAALQCAMLSATIRVVPYALKDVIQFPVRIAWDGIASAEGGAPQREQLNLIKLGDSSPVFKKVTFNRRGRFELAVEYVFFVYHTHTHTRTHSLRTIMLVDYSNHRAVYRQ